MSPRPSRQQAEDFLKFANHLADAARGPTLQHFRERIDIDNKLDSGFDPVTVADRDAEAAIRALIESHHPEHGIIGEEHGVKESQSGLNWVLDPIDGTRAFISGSPLWGTLIALGDKEGPFLGILDQPYIGERYWGISLPDFKAAGIAGPRGNATLKTKDCAHISDAILSTTHPDLFESQSEKSAFSDLCDKVRMTRYGGDCYGYGLLGPRLYGPCCRSRSAIL